MKQKKLNLKALEASLPSLNSSDAKNILGGNGYADGVIELEEVVVVGNTGNGNTHDDYDPDQDNQDYDPDYDHDNTQDGDQSQDTNIGLPNLPSTVEQQLLSTGACVSYAMAFVSTYLGSSITGPNMALNISQTTGLPMNSTMIQGLTVTEATQAIQAIFNTNSLTSTAGINTAIDNGYPVLANLNAVGGAGHEVVIVDYNNTAGTYTIADSNTGSYHDVPQGDINFGGGVFEVTGVKP
jgi:hypothetical protein